jgi:hypothetical protein
MAYQIDRVVGGELAVNLGRGFAELDSVINAVVFGHL